MKKQAKPQPNLHLYKIDQTGLQAYIKAILDFKGITYLEWHGNIFSVRFPTKPLFVSHMDTVGENDVHKSLLLKGDILKRRGHYVLGADDKAGVNILLDHIDNINFCFTVDEEIGCLGATDLKRHGPFLDLLEQVPCAIEYDRRNNADLIAYCNDDLIEVIEGLTHYREASGLFTDITEWESFMPSVNLSCGYYNAHLGTEYLHLGHWREAHATLPILNELTGPFELSPPTAEYGGYSTYGYSMHEDEYDSYQRYWEDKLMGYPEPTEPSTDELNNIWAEQHLKVCEYCGAKETLNTDFYEVSGYDVLCGKCLDFMYGVKKL